MFVHDLEYPRERPAHAVMPLGQRTRCDSGSAFTTTVWADGWVAARSSRLYGSSRRSGPLATRDGRDIPKANWNQLLREVHMRAAEEPSTLVTGSPSRESVTASQRLVPTQVPAPGESEHRERARQSSDELPMPGHTCLRLASRSW